MGRYFDALDYLTTMRRVYDSDRGVKYIYDRYRRDIEQKVIPETVQLEDYVQLQYHWLIRVDPFYWSPELVTMLEGLSEKLPDCTIREDLFPVRGGYFYFDQPIHIGRIPVVDGGEPEIEEVLRGFFWRMQKGRPDDDQNGRLFASLTTILEFEDQPGQGFIGHTWPWAIGDNYLDWITTARKRLTEQGMAIELSVRERAKQDQIFMRVVRIALSAFLLLNQRVLRVEKQSAPRHAMKRAAKHLREQVPQIQVVRLRKEIRLPQEPGQEPVEFQCHWLVRGHWRQQACGPGMKDRRPVYIWPYIKGNMEAPFKAPDERLFAVVR